MRKRQKNPGKTEHERPHLVLVTEKLNGQIDLPNKN